MNCSAETPARRPPREVPKPLQLPPNIIGKEPALVSISTVTGTPPRHRARDSSDERFLTARPESIETEVPRLFAPLTVDQQRIIDLTAHAFFVSDRR